VVERAFVFQEHTVSIHPGDGEDFTSVIVRKEDLVSSGHRMCLRVNRLKYATVDLHLPVLRLERKDP
jgi:hypothetical protein